MTRNLTLATLAVCFWASCSATSDASPDFGLFENGENHVATFSGFADNFEACQVAAAAFDRESGADPAAWAAVGKKPDVWVCSKL